MQLGGSIYSAAMASAVRALDASTAPPKTGDGNGPYGAGAAEAAQPFASVPSMIPPEKTESATPAPAEPPLAHVFQASQALRIGLMQLSSTGRDQRSAPPASAHARRPWLVRELGWETARALGWNTSAYTDSELQALGEQTILDHALHDEKGAGGTLLFMLAKLARKLSARAVWQGDHDKLAEEVSTFLQEEFKDEFAIFHQIVDLSRRRMPTRWDLAVELLKSIELDPERKVETTELIDPENILATNERKTATQFYFDHDALSAAQVALMTDRPLTQAEIAGMLARLPASLEAEFDRQFETHAQGIAAATIRLFQSWLDAIAKKHGIDTSQATIEVSSARLQEYRCEVQVLHGAAFRYEGASQTETRANGYFMNIRSGEAEYRYFLSTADGTAHSMPGDIPVADWANTHQQKVFPPLPHGAGPLSKFRVEVDQLGGGDRPAMSTWLTPPLRERARASREAARGQTSAEAALDQLLDLIPFRRTVVALRKGDLDTAISSGAIDALMLLIPLVCSGMRVAAAAGRAVAPLTRLIEGTIQADALAGMMATGAELPDLRTSLRLALESDNRTLLAGQRITPMDVERMATALQATHPALAGDLERAAAQTRGTAVSDDWWQLAAPAPSASDTGIATLDYLEAHARTGEVMDLLPYGDTTHRAYTAVHPVSGERTGSILLADGDGWLHPTMPIDALERYRVNATELQRALDGQRPDAAGTVTLGDRHYARIGADYIEVAPDHASTTERSIWRAVAPREAKRDIVTHRLYYDREKALWRHADTPQLKGGGVGWSGSANRRRVAPSPAERADAPSPSTGWEPDSKTFHRMLVGRMESPTTDEQRRGIVEILDKMASKPRGKVILGAMRAHYELLGETPRIVLRDVSDPMQTRPSSARAIPGATWHFDLDALRGESDDALQNELAAVYNNMTGLLEDVDPYASIRANGGPALDPDLEERWTIWIGDDQVRVVDTGNNKKAYVASWRVTAVEQLREQLRELRCYGGFARGTMRAVLTGEWDGKPARMKIDLSHLELEEIPPLPPDVEALNLSHNAILYWDDLPDGLKVLDASWNPGDGVLEALPRGLEGLDISGIGVRTLPANLPPTLKWVSATYNEIKALPKLPESLEMLAVSGNPITRLPEDLPSTLTELHATQCQLSELPARMPENLKLLVITDNRFESLPDVWPPHLEELRMGHHRRLTTLPRLPPTLRILDARWCGMKSLPSGLPPQLQDLRLDGNRLRSLPVDLPAGLQTLSVRRNLLTELPAGIDRLTSCEIYAEENFIPRIAGQPVSQEQPGPRIFLSVNDYDPARKATSGSVAQAVRAWMPHTDELAITRWDAISASLADEADGERNSGGRAFLAFLDALRNTVSFRNTDFRASVQEWLAELSKPERKNLLQTTLQMCVSSTETCEDRVSFTLTELKKLRLYDDIRLGQYDGHVADAVDVLRQTFRLRRLQEIAVRKIATLEHSDDVEVYLGYAVRLREQLDLSTVVPYMRHFVWSHISRKDLDLALRDVLSAERAYFYKDLVLDDTWNQLLKRKLPERYRQAEETLTTLVDVPLQEKIRLELTNLGLDPEDLDAQRNIGLTVWRDMKYRVLEPLTRDLLKAERVPPITIRRSWFGTDPAR